MICGLKADNTLVANEPTAVCTCVAIALAAFIAAVKKMFKSIFTP